MSALIIFGPAKVTRTTLQNAASVASMMITTECIITDIPSKEDSQDSAGAAGAMGGMM